MSKIENLLAHYTKVLNDLDFQVHPNTGKITYGPDDIEVLIDEKTWLLPIEKVLDNAPWKVSVGFHPMAQNVIMAESETSNYLQMALNLAINMRLSAAMLALVKFAADSSQHEGVSTKVSKFLTKVPDVSATTAKRFEQIWKASSAGASQMRFLSFYTKQNGTLDGKRHSRLVVVSSPFLENIANGEGKIFGVKCTAKDMEVYKTIFETILPDASDVSTYSAGSSVSDGPSYIAQLKAFHGVAEAINEVLTKYKSIIPEAATLKFKLDWFDDLDHLKSWGAAIPPLPGSRGEEVMTSSDGAAKAATDQARSKMQRPKDPEDVRPQAKEPWEDDRKEAAREERTEDRRESRREPERRESRGPSLSDVLRGATAAPRRDDRYDRRDDRRDDRYDDRDRGPSWLSTMGDNKPVDLGSSRRDDRDDRRSGRRPTLSETLGGRSGGRGLGF